MLSPGIKLGPYEILEPIGRGGMGEVYRARDTKLHREVAIKVLPESLAADPERIARFEREARVLASLNHPNIAAVYGVDDSSEVKALVLELVEGPTLQDRIESGAIPVDEALPIARQIAEAFEAAHEKGIVHRDLKPANVKVDRAGTVKVLDFGLAKALDPVVSSSPDLTHSPTLSIGTQAGMILGTAAYMSPEQARGKPVDRRADVWAFGVVLFEMLSGRRLFHGETVSDTLAAVIKEEPDWQFLPPEVPSSIRALLRRCLQKDPRQRLQAIGEARITIDDVLSGSPGAAATDAEEARAGTRRPVVLPWALAAVLAVVVAGLGILAIRRPRRSPPAPVLSFVPPPPGTTLRSYGFGSGRVVVSPDGARLAFSATDQDGVTRLWVRPLNSASATPVKGTEDAASPFWSPDGRSLGFVANGKLKTADLSDGDVETLADADWETVGAWSPRETILFKPPGVGVNPLSKIAASGGRTSGVTKLASDERTHDSPSFLPDGKHFLFAARRADGNCRLKMGSLDSGEVATILEGSCFGLYAGGYLLFGRGLDVFAQRFDPATARLSGRAAFLARAADCSAAGDSVLAYQARSETSRLEWFDRSGNSLGTVGNPAIYRSPKISPDGKQILSGIMDRETRSVDLWSLPAAGGESTRLTFDSGGKTWSVWSPDGKYVSYAGPVKGTPGTMAIFRKTADGSREAEKLLTASPNEGQLFSVDWSPDGRSLSFDAFDIKSGQCENWILPLFGDRKPFQVSPVAADQFDGIFSPDGHWLAYFSYESGHPEVYVVPFPGPGGKYQISHGGGWLARWDGRGRLYFLTMGNRLMEADLAVSASSVRVNAIHPLFAIRPPNMAMPLFDVTADGQKFIVATSDAPEASSITLVANWTELLASRQERP